MNDAVIAVLITSVVGVILRVLEWLFTRGPKTQDAADARQKEVNDLADRIRNELRDENQEIKLENKVIKAENQGIKEENQDLKERVSKLERQMQLALRHNLRLDGRVRRYRQGVEVLIRQLELAGIIPDWRPSADDLRDEAVDSDEADNSGTVPRTA